MAACSEGIHQHGEFIHHHALDVVKSLLIMDLTDFGADPSVKFMVFVLNKCKQKICPERLHFSLYKRINNDQLLSHVFSFLGLFTLHPTFLI